MINIIFNLLNHKKSDNNERQNYGIACGILGIFLNIILFSMKFIIGSISNSIAITADAFNNLSDAGSSLITLVGFALSGLKPDLEHPFGHGRFEYVSGLIVSLLIILMGFELFINSIKKIITPTAITYSNILIYVLIISITVKLYMAYYNNKVGKKIESATIKAAVIDSLSDSIATSLVLIATIINHLSTINIDGYAGLIVAAFILKSGYQSAQETISPLLGQPPKKEFVDKINKIIASHPQIIGIHDLIVHDYGPYRTMVSLHAEVPSSGDILTMHDIINDAEEELKQILNCDAIIHMDPVVINDKQTNKTKTDIIEKLKAIDERISIHDFRIIKGNKRPKIFFDVVIPYDFEDDDDVILQKINDLISDINPNFSTYIGIDRS